MWQFLTKFGFIPFIFFEFIGFFSMGMMEFWLYYLVFPISQSLFPHPDSLHGDNVWLVAMYYGL